MADRDFTEQQQRSAEPVLVIVERAVEHRGQTDIGLSDDTSCSTDDSSQVDPGGKSKNTYERD